MLPGVCVGGGTHVRTHCMSARLHRLGLGRTWQWKLSCLIAEGCNSKRAMGVSKRLFWWWCFGARPSVEGHFGLLSLVVSSSSPSSMPTVYHPKGSCRSQWMMFFKIAVVCHSLHLLLFQVSTLSKCIKGKTQSGHISVIVIITLITSVIILKRGIRVPRAPLLLLPTLVGEITIGLASVSGHSAKVSMILLTLIYGDRGAVALYIYIHIHIYAL